MDVKTSVAGENLFEVEVRHPEVVDDEKEEFAVRRVVGALMEGLEKRGGGRQENNIILLSSTARVTGCNHARIRLSKPT